MSKRYLIALVAAGSILIGAIGGHSHSSLALLRVVVVGVAALLAVVTLRVEGRRPDIDTRGHGDREEPDPAFAPRANQTASRG